MIKSLILLFLLSCTYSWGQDNIVDFNDVILFTNGETVRCEILERDNRSLYYNILKNGELRKVQVLRKRVYSITKNDTTINLSHAKANQTGERFIMDLNSFSFEFYTGVTEYVFDETYTIPFDTNEYNRRTSYGQMIPLGFTIGFKNYFRGSPEKFISGVKYGVTAELAFGRELTHAVGLSIGYTGLLKLRDEMGIEFNFDTGVGLVRWDIEYGFIGQHFSKSVSYIQLNPSVLFRYKDMGIGVGYGYYFLNNSANYNPRKQSLKLYINYNIN